jgi:hypothetical protein
VDDLIDVIGGYARLGGGSGNVENLSCKSAALSHSILTRLVENFDLVTVGERAAVPGVAVLPPHGVGDRLRQSSVRRQRVDGSQRARVGEVGERVVVTGSLRFVHCLVNAPVTLEALLRTEEAVLDSELQASRAL